MNQPNIRKLYLSFILYSLCVALCSSLLTILIYSHLYGEKVQYISYKELEPRLAGNPELAKRLISISKYILPTVVNVTSKQIAYSYGPGSLGDLFEHFFNIPKYYQSTGSGFVISEDGYIVTNFHVVKDANEVFVSFINKKTVKASIVGADPKTDIALLKITDARDLAMLKRQKAFQVAELGTSEDLEVGEMVLAVGNPFALNHSVSFGIISAKGRHNVGIVAYENFIQTDAAVNPGNSGGPLVSVRTGKVIGINTAILSKSGGFQGIAFTIPIDMAKRVIADLKTKGHVERGYLGVSVQEMNEEIAKLLGTHSTSGVLVQKVYPDSPAAKAGLQRGDIILEFGGKKIESLRDFQNQLAMTPIGTTVPITIERRGKIMKLNVTVESKEAAFKAKKRKLPLGIVVKEITPELAEQYGIQPYIGLLIDAVRQGSVAYRVGLRPGQIIVSVNRKRVKTIQDFEKAIQPFYQGQRVLIEGIDGDTYFYVVIGR
ncbi:MAG: Do family serine endopeptidase [Planctomycetota bacterium]|nr:MAG: Do family serine endopeptidase [Planctomycetota bacterium]